jgi:GT2 family glycosyltransferase
MKYSVIIPTFNHLEDCLKPCIDSILQYTIPTDLEVIVVANGCTDGTKAYLETLPDFIKILWFNEALGYTKATNEGIKVSSGDYLALLNNDCVLLPQNKNDWLNILEAPFRVNQQTGITGVTKINCQYSLRKFLIFFCVMIKREVFSKIGLLDESFSPGGGDDIDFCIRAEDAGYTLSQVPVETKEWSYSTGFPIFHKAEGTFGTISGWHEIFHYNMNKIREKYNVQLKLGNNFERAVIGKEQDIPPRETSRYKWARENIVGKKVLEIGCSSGYGLRFLKDIDGLDYLGIDYDKKIVEYATSQFGPYFKQADINTFQFEHYDTIIAFEILEHIPNGREMAQKLKQHCKCLLATCPYKEPVGFWGHHHQLHGLTEQDFPGFKYQFIDDNGNVGDKPHNTQINLMMMKWTQDVGHIDAPPTIVAYISSKDRYHTTLPMALSSLITQTLKPNKIMIFLDGEHEDLRENEVYKNLFILMQTKGIQWEMVFSLKKGQTHNHHWVSQNCQQDFIWRVDDDNICESNVLETLMGHMKDPKVGAVAGLVIDPKMYSMLPPNASNKIADIGGCPNIQWFRHPTNEIKEVEHLYSSFLYRKEAGKHGYCLELSVCGHREETIMSHELYRKGWKLLVDPSAITWHCRYSTNGIRAFNNPEFFEADDKIFQNKLKEWGLSDAVTKLICLDAGLGDHWCFKSIFSEIREKYKNKKIVLAVCYPFVFADEPNIKIISIDEAKQMVGDIDQYNIYKWMWNKDWKGQLADAFRGLYL